MKSAVLKTVCILGACSALLSAQAGSTDDGESTPTTTPIRHLVVIFQENNSFDHYFGTYPYAANPPGEPTFTARLARRKWII